MDRLSNLVSILRADGPLMEMLALCRDRLPVNAYIGAGAIRDIVWDHAHGNEHASNGDVDVIFFDPALLPDADAEFSRRLTAANPQIRWDVTNQAHVHLWYGDYFGAEVQQLHTLEQAIATWPDTATAVAVRLNDGGSLEVVAPFGLDDLFDLVLRWNPSRISYDDYLARIDAKKWLLRWPRLRLRSD